MSTKGRLLSSNVDLLTEIHDNMVGESVFVLKGNGFIGKVTKVLDEEYFLVKDSVNNEYKVSCFEIRSLTDSSYDYTKNYV